MMRCRRSASGPPVMPVSAGCTDQIVEPLIVWPNGSSPGFRFDAGKPRLLAQTIWWPAETGDVLTMAIVLRQSLLDGRRRTFPCRPTIFGLQGACAGKIAGNAVPTRRKLAIGIWCPPPARVMPATDRLGRLLESGRRRTVVAPGALCDPTVAPAGITPIPSVLAGQKV